MWRDAQVRERERLWPGVERFLDGLPPRLFEQAKLLEYDLALRCSSSGQFRDIFLGADQFPALSIGSWLIDDLSIAAGARREQAERHLFMAAVLIAARSHVIASMLDASSFYDVEHVALVQSLSERALTELARVAPRSSRFREAREAIALAGLEAMLDARQRWRTRGELDDPDEYLAPRWSAPGKLIALAALELGPRLDVAPAVEAMLDGVAAAFEIKSSLSSIHADLLQGRPTYPIAVVARAAGLSLQPWPDATLMLGALVATNSLEAILESALDRIRVGHRVAIDLGLATFAQYLVDVQAGFESRWPVHGSSDEPVARGAREPRSVARRSAVPLVTIARHPIEKALGMAEAFLLSDLTFRESWEAHRDGMFGAPIVVSRFPAGLILEILCGHGHDLSAEVDDFLGFTAANRFRYFDHAWSDVDSDTIGVFLRLARHATPGGGHGEAATAVLGCLERDVAASGEIPVWVADCDDRPEHRPAVPHLGEGCGTVVAHLLLGLLAHEPERHAETIGRGSIRLLDRIIEVGVGANVNYPRTYALAAFGRLISALEDPGSGLEVDAATRRATRKARRVLAGELERAIARRSLTAQQAALLAIACLDLGHPDKIDAGWTTTILKSQRFDGSWIGEPFAAAPNRGLAVTWYSSTLLTSALCYDALMRNEKPLTRRSR